MFSLMCLDNFGVFPTILQSFPKTSKEFPNFFKNLSENDLTIFEGFRNISKSSENLPKIRVVCIYSKITHTQWIEILNSIFLCKIVIKNIVFTT